MKCTKKVVVDVRSELGIEEPREDEIDEFSEVKGLLQYATQLRMIYDTLYKKSHFPVKYSTREVVGTMDEEDGDLNLIYGDNYD